MSQLQIQVCLVLLCIIEVRASTVNLCTLQNNAAAVQQGYFSDTATNTSIYRTVSDARSVIECVTYCKADLHCNSAIYQKDNKCLLIDTYNSVSAATSTNHFSEEYLVELRQVESCQSPCSGNTVCLLDCTDGADISETSCVDLSGAQESCKFSPISYSKEYYLYNLDVESSQHGHTFFSINFGKKHAHTAVRVRFRGTLRSGYGNINSYGVWKILFNAADCSDPGKIESIHFNQDSNLNQHRASGIEGICESLPAGTIEISLTVLTAESSVSRVGAFTEASRLYVDEFDIISDQPDEVTQSECPNLAVFNNREEAFTLHTGLSNNSLALWSMQYRKLENDTWLKVNLDFTIRIVTTVRKCVIWYIYVDGNQCQPHPLGRILALLANENLVSNEHRSVEVEGYCSNIASGLLTLSLYVDDCPMEAPGTDGVHTGFSAITQRMIVEEFRTETNINIAMAAEGKTLYRVPALNMVIHSAYALAVSANSGTVWTVTDYQKKYASSGLKLTLSSDARNVKSASYECCRYFFLINNGECADPGPIEGIIHTNSITILHSPLFIEGICEGVPAGTVTLAVNVGPCQGESSTGDCYFGWNSYMQMMVAEAYVERETINF